MEFEHAESAPLSIEPIIVNSTDVVTEISKEEIDEANKMMTRRKAPGVDAISEVIKEGGEKMTDMGHSFIKYYLQKKTFRK